MKPLVGLKRLANPVHDPQPLKSPSLGLRELPAVALVSEKGLLEATKTVLETVR